MASSDAKPIPIKNAAYRVTFPIFDADGDPVAGAAGLDSEVSKDGGTFADCTNEATEIATSSGVYYLDLTSTEMNADTVAICIKTSTSGAKTTILILYPQESGDIKVDVQSYGGTAGTFSGGRPEVNASHWGGTAVGSANVLIDGAITAAKIATGAIDADAIASDAITAIQSGLALASDLATAIGYIDSEVAAIMAVTDKLDTALESDGASGYQFTALGLENAPSGSGSSDWTADERDAIRAILGIPGSGTTPADPSAGILDTIRDLVVTVDTVADAVKAKTDNLPSDPADASDIASAFGTVNSTLGTIAGYLDTEVAAILAAVDTEVAAIKAKTDNLPTDPADQSAVEAAITAATSPLATAANLATLAGYVDTEVAAIKAKTDNLPSDPADASDIAGAFSTVNSTLTTLGGYIDTEVAAIKAKTDNLPSDPADQSAVEAAITAATNGLATASSLSTVAGNVASILADTGTDGVVVAAGSKTGYALTSGERDSIAAAILDLAAGIQTDWTLREALRVILAAAAGKINGANTSTVNIRDVGDSKNRIVATVDATGRTAVTYDKS